MDYRRIQLTGESTYIISLPKKWIRKNNLGKGDTLAVIERGDNLSIKSKEDKETKTEIDLDKKSQALLARILITKYIQGFDTIRIRSKKYIAPDIRECLRNISRLLIGMEEFGEGSNEIVFRMLMDEKDNIEDTVLRMHNMSLSSLRELLKNITPKENNPHVLESIIQRDDEIDKFYFLVLRQVSSFSAYEAVMWIQIAKSVERISDHIEKIAKLIRQGGSIKEEHLPHYELLIDMYASVKGALKNRSIEAANDILMNLEKLKAKEKEITYMTQTGKPESLLSYESLKRIREYISDIAEAIINMI